MNVELVRQLLGVFGDKAPPVTVDQPTGAIVVGPFTISKNVTPVKGLRGPMEVASYILDVDTGDGDIMELHGGTDFATVATKLVGEYGEYMARSVLDMLATDAMAADWQADQQALRDAYNEGQAYYKATPPGERDVVKANPYPYGIAHYDEWVKGYNRADEETVF